MQFHVEQPEFGAKALRREVGAAVYRNQREWKLRRVLLTTFKFLLCLCAVLVLVRALIYLFQGEFRFVVLNLLLAGGEIWVALNWDRVWCSLSGTLTLRTLRPPADTRFYETYLEDLDKGIDLKVEYHALHALYEGTLGYYLFLSPHALLILQKKYFTQGDPEEFRDFIQCATGKPFTFVK